MEVLLISGAKDVGKTEICKFIDNILKKNNYKQIKLEETGDINNDFIALYESMNKKNVSKKIIINSAADNKDCVKKFYVFCQNKAEDVDLIITACRDGTKNITKNDF